MNNIMLFGGVIGTLLIFVCLGLICKVSANKGRSNDNEIRIDDNLFPPEGQGTGDAPTEIREM